MPAISRFYGIVIKMYLRQKEHNPPHIHAVYGECVGSIDIKALEMMEGDLPKKALAMVIEWTALHQQELLAMWDNQEFKQIEPLE